jgi:hypothetical protein
MNPNFLPITVAVAVASYRTSIDHRMWSDELSAAPCGVR